MNWIDNSFPCSKNILVKLRNTGNLIEANLKNLDGKIVLYPKEPAEGVSPGQAAVIYDKYNKNHVLGGGWIVSTESSFFKKFLWCSKSYFFEKCQNRREMVQNGQKWSKMVEKVKFSE